MDKWILQCKKADFAYLARKFSISPMLARIIVNRGLKKDDEIDFFLNGDLSYLYDPYLFKNMAGSVECILDNIKLNKKILIIGDYDVDGVCSVFILKSFLEALNGDVDIRLPDRVLDGYGMSVNMAVEAYNNDVSLIITCDNGISAIDAVKKAKELGLQVIVTDHHEPQEILPPADYIINAKQPGCEYPNKEICGAGVAYKVVIGLIKRLKSTGDLTDSLALLADNLIQFAGIATIADIVSLQGENRIIAKEGIERLKTTDNLGLKALIDAKDIIPQKLHSFHIGFILGPCINSAGRLKNAKIAFDLLCAPNIEEAKILASQLSELNEYRKSMTMEQTKIAEQIIAGDQEKGISDRIIVINLPEAHESVAGIIAGKIKEKYNKPAMVVTSSKEGLKGSARSTDEYNIAKAFAKHKELFKKYGGHAKAAGFTLNCSVEQLRLVLNSDPDVNLIDFNKKIWIDMQLPFRYVNEAFVHELALLDPFGVDNPKPVFAEKDVKIIKIQLVGQRCNVLKMILENSDGDRIDAVLFGHGNPLNEKYEELSLDLNQLHSILYYPEINEFRGMKSINAVIYDIR